MYYRTYTNSKQEYIATLLGEWVIFDLPENKYSVCLIIGEETECKSSHDDTPYG